MKISPPILRISRATEEVEEDLKFLQHRGVLEEKSPSSSVEAPAGAPAQGGGREAQGERQSSNLRALTFFLVGIVCPLLLGGSLYIGGKGAHSLQAKQCGTKGKN